MATYIEDIEVKTISANDYMISLNAATESLPSNTVGIKIDDNGETKIAIVKELLHDAIHKIVRIKQTLCKQGVNGNYFEEMTKNCYIRNSNYVNTTTGDRVEYEEAFTDDVLNAGYDYQYDWYFSQYVITSSVAMKVPMIKSLTENFTV